MIEKTGKINIFSKLSLRIITVVFLITLISMLISSQVSTYFIKSDAISSSKLFLGRLTDKVEKELVYMNSFTAKLSSAIYKYGDLHGLEDYFQRYEINREVDNLVKGNNDVESVYIFFDRGSKVYFISYKPGTQGTGVKNTEDFFDAGMYHRFINSDQLWDFIDIREIKPVYFDNPLGNNNSSKVMTLMKRLPAGDLDSRDAIMVNIEDKSMLKLIAGNYLPQKSIVLITEKTGGVVLSYSNDSETEIGLSAEDIETINGLDGMEKKGYFKHRINHVTCYLIQMDSDIYNWKYTLIIPKSVLLKPVIVVNIVFFAFSALALICGGIFSILIDRRYFQPVLGIVKLLKSKNGDSEYTEPVQLEHKRKKQKNNELKQLEGYVEQIIYRNDKQESQIQRYFSYYKERILLAVINGDNNIVDGLNLDEILSQKAQGRHCCILMNIREKLPPDKGVDYVAGDSNMVAAGFENSLSVYGQAEKIIIDRHRIVFLLTIRESLDTAALTECMQKFLDEHREQCLIYNVAVGPFYDSFKMVRNSYLIAERALINLADDDGSRVFCADEFMEYNDNVCTYPGKIESLIIDAVCMQDCEKTVEHTHAFYTEIKEKKGTMRKARKYTFQLLYNLARQLNEAGIQGGDRLEVINVFEDIENLKSIHELEIWMVKTITDHMMSKTKKENRTYNIDLIDKIMKYIGEHYMDNNLGLNTIADYVYLSPSYLGRLFKEISGTTFIDYLIKVRMEAAVDLLIKKNVNISDIVERVGYCSVQSFGRVFRNYYKCSPGEYRRKFASALITGGNNGE